VPHSVGEVKLTQASHDPVSEQAVAGCVRDCLEPAVGIEFAKDALDVIAHGDWTHVELRGDRPGVGARADQPEDLEFSAG
jgi:hypothetical protein